MHKAERVARYNVFKVLVDMHKIVSTRAAEHLTASTSRLGPIAYAAVVLAILATAGIAHAEDAKIVCGADRPAPLFNRWQEDWSVLADPCVPRQPFDDLKYVSLGGDPHSYLSLGANLRERFEYNNAPLFGIGTSRADSYLLQRADVSADVRLGRHLQFFAQLADARVFGKDSVSAVDRNPVDVQQAFVAWVSPLGPGTFKFRVGRQEMAFDLQRFISVRDGPNVRQAYDAVWVDYELDKWRFLGYLTQPVQNRNGRVFDDVSNRHLTFSGVRFDRKDVGPGDLSGYYSAYNKTGASYIDASGGEHRNVYDLRYSGKRGAVDWDVEGMYQSGRVGTKSISAWALGSVFGYTVASPWSPRIGIQLDMASGDRHSKDGSTGTFNPLFPNGYYFTLAGYTGYSNVIHLKPSITLKPKADLTLLGAVGLQWRHSTADAVYQQPSTPVPGTAGQGGHWTGAYLQLRADWAMTKTLTSAVEAVHYQAGNALRSAGGRNSDYVGLELKYGW